MSRITDKLPIVQASLDLTTLDEAQAAAHRAVVAVRMDFRGHFGYRC